MELDEDPGLEYTDDLRLGLSTSRGGSLCCQNVVWGFGSLALASVFDNMEQLAEIAHIKTELGRESLGYI